MLYAVLWLGYLWICWAGSRVALQVPRRSRRCWRSKSWYTSAYCMLKTLRSARKTETLWRLSMLWAREFCWALGLIIQGSSRIGIWDNLRYWCKWDPLIISWISFMVLPWRQYTQFSISTSLGILRTMGWGSSHFQLRLIENKSMR